MENHLQIDQETRRKIEEISKNTWSERTRARLRVISMAGQDKHSIAEIARATGTSAPSVLKYIRLFQAGGLDAVLKTATSTHDIYSRLDVETLSLLRKKIENNEFVDSIEIKKWLANRSIEIPQPLLLRLLTKLGWNTKETPDFQLDPENIREIEETLKNTQNKRRAKRLQVILMAGKGNSSAAKIARTVGVSNPTVFKSIRLFQTGGLNGLMEVDYQGLTARSRLGLEMHALLQEKVKNGEFGHTREILQWLEDHSVKMSRGLLYYYLHKFNWVRKNRLQVDPQHTAEIEEALKTAQDERSRKRLQVVLMACQNNPDGEKIAKTVGVSYATVVTNVQRFHAGGIKKLLETGYAQQTEHSLLGDEIETLLREKIERDEFTHASDAQKWLESHSVKVSPRLVHYYLKKFGWKHAKPQRKTMKKPRKTDATYETPATDPTPQAPDKNEQPPPQQQDSCQWNEPSPPAPVNPPAQDKV
ncbi:MAG: helix-turn-helix domain-containing protein [Puniceicoccales bacterium]|nr:helix-turn-helix domain-containing protein [Puniceicoccales bacterium]